MLHAGMHPTLAGVILGAADAGACRLRRRRRDAREGAGTNAPVTRVEGALHPWVAFGIMPLFALANAGVSLSGFRLHGGVPPMAVAGGIVAGLVVGKPVGIGLAAVPRREA